MWCLSLGLSARPSMASSSDDDQVVPAIPRARWAVICCVSSDGERFVTKKIVEALISTYVGAGWEVLICDSDLLTQGITDVRREDERGRR
jgi:hypothetical protein